MMTSTKPLVCCGFTPCVQRILEYSKLEKGQVNRALRVSLGVGGKGANTARMVTQLGGLPELIGFAGGANGRLLEKMLQNEGVAFQHVEVSGETRICQTLLEAGNPEVTELVEEMPAVSDEEWNRMISLFRSLNLSESVIAISGKLPAGVPVDAYAQITGLVAEQNGAVVLDAPEEPLLLALKYKPQLVKINDVELLQALGGDDVIVASQELLRRGAQSVLITRGSRTAFFMDSARSLELVPPSIDAVNPVGSGDPVTAGIAVELSRGKTMDEALLTGMACGAANALNLVSGLLRLDDVNRLRHEVLMKPMN
jgi:tagatose 6-phosphate kinase